MVSNYLFLEIYNKGTSHHQHHKINSRYGISNLLVIVVGNIKRLSGEEPTVGYIYVYLRTIVDVSWCLFYHVYEFLTFHYLLQYKKQTIKIYNTIPIVKIFFDEYEWQQSPWPLIFWVSLLNIYVYRWYLFIRRKGKVARNHI